MFPYKGRTVIVGFNQTVLHTLSASIFSFSIIFSFSLPLLATCDLCFNI